MHLKNDWPTNSARSWGTWLPILLLMSIHLMLFTYGYRRTADEVRYLQKTVEGWESIREFAIISAVHQGRIGQFILIPLNALSTYFSDWFFIRLAFALLHAGVLVAFAAYCSLLFRINVTGALLVVLVAMQPLTVDPMPPVAFPLQNTIPFLCVLLARCAMVRKRRNGDRQRQAANFLAHLVFVAAMATTEFAFLLGTALLAAEYLQAFALAIRLRRSVSGALVDIITSKSFRVDIASVMGSLTIYLLFRWFNPSTYEGNTLDAIFEGRRLLETAVRHVMAGTFLSQLDLAIFAVPWSVLLMAIAAGGVTVVCLLLSIRDVRGIRAPLQTAGIAVVLMLYVTFPIAATAKQQHWCVDDNTCGYLDSRLAYLGFGVMVLSLLAFGLQRAATPGGRKGVVAVAALLLGLISTVTYVTNWRQAQVMIINSIPWLRAAMLACHPEYQPKSNNELPRLLDPKDRVRLHPDEDRGQFWQLYLAHRAQSAKCSSDPDLRQAELKEIESFIPVVIPGKVVRFSQETGAQYLGSGWSRPEPWLVWSDGNAVELILKVGDVSRSAALSVVLAFRVYFGPSVSAQTISVTVDGAVVDRWTFTKDTQRNDDHEGRIVLSPKVLRRGDVRIGLQIATPRNPEAEGKSAETRRLGIGIQEIRFLD